MNLGCDDDEHDQPIDGELVLWCRQHGANFGPIAAAFSAEGWRGVVAVDDIEPGTCVLSVPRNILISTESARDDDFQACLATCHRNFAPQQLLAAHLLAEVAKGPASFWCTYLRSLPRRYTTALSFTSEAVDELQVCSGIQRAQEAVEEAVRQWKDALPLLRALNLPPKVQSRQAWLWAAATLSTRTMAMPGDEAGALTPFGDLHNHHPPAPPYTPQLAQHCSGRQSHAELSGDGHLDESTDLYNIFARKRYRAGEEVFLCYGRHTNLDLLVFYGFVLLDHANPHDTAVLPAHVLPEEILQQLHRAGVHPVLHANGNPSFELLRALRLAGASKPERKAKAFLALEDKAISPSSERWALSTLGKACQQALSALPTTAEHDTALLAGGTRLTECMRVAVQWRLGYKTVLLRASLVCAEALAAAG